MPTKSRRRWESLTSKIAQYISRSPDRSVFDVRRQRKAETWSLGDLEPPSRFIWRLVEISRTSTQPGTIQNVADCPSKVYIQLETAAHQLQGLPAALSIRNISNN